MIISDAFLVIALLKEDAHQLSSPCLLSILPAALYVHHPSFHYDSPGEPPQRDYDAVYSQYKIS